MGFAHRASVAAGVGFAVAAIAGCGSSGGSLLSASQANTLSEQLNTVEQALDNNACTTAQRALSRFQNTLDGLSGVNSTLLENLDQGASTIATLTSNECQTRTVSTPKKTHPKTTTSTVTTTTATQTIPTVTTQTTPTYTTTTYTTPTETTPYTSTTGGYSPTGGSTTTTATDTTTTPSSGGQGLDSTTTYGATTGATTDSTTSTTNYGDTGTGDDSQGYTGDGSGSGF